MRKHSVRKWLHAVLDLLPLLVIPIFGIYIINHSPEPLSITTSGYVYERKFTTNVVNDPSTDLVNGNAYLFEIGINYGAEGSRLTFYSSNENYIYFEVIQLNGSFVPIVDTGFNYVSNIDFKYSWLATYQSVFVASDIENEPIFELFSSGTLPIGERNGKIKFIATYDDYYSSFFDDYVSVRALPDNLNPFVGHYTDGIVYDDTDIGSQFIYSLYHVTDEYFNFNDVFNFRDIYNWFEVNMFNGNAPIVAYIIWNIIVYEFIMDILFLVYSVFMFLIDFAEGTLEKFTGWCTRG